MILIAALGFAAVGADSSADEIQTETSSVLPESLSARVAAASFSALLNPEIEQPAAPEVLTAVLPAATPQAEPVPTTTTTTTTAPTTTTTAPPATTTTKPPATTTTTTTTAPPATTTTVPETTTTVPETTTTTTTAPPVDGGSRDVEEWRSLVAQYFPENLVDEALTVIKCESNGDPLAYNPNSGASGLFQFISNTWGWSSVQAGFGGSSPFEPEANIGAAAWLVQTSLNQGKSAWAHWSCKP